MITFDRIQIKDFCNIKKADIDLTHPVVVFQGANGQGKSAVIEAISICISDKKRSSRLTDYISRGQKSSHIILDGQLLGKAISIDLTIGESSNVYIITYDGKSYKGNEATEFLKNHEINYYTDIMLMMQDDENISQLTPAVRSNYIRKLLNFDFNEQIKIVDEKISNLTKNIEEVDRDILNTDQFILHNEDRIEDELTPIDQSIIDQDKGEIEQLETLSKEIESLNDTKTTLMNKIASCNNQINSKRIEVNRCNLKIESLEQSKEKAKELKEAILKNEKTIALLEKEIESSNIELKSIKEQLPKYDIKLNEYKSQLELTQHNQGELQRFKKLIDQGKCPHCGQDTSKFGEQEILEHFGSLDIDSQLSKFVDQIKNIKEEILKNENSIKEANRESSKLESCVSYNNKEIKKLKDINDSSIINDTSIEEEIYKYALNIKNLNKEILELEDELKKHNEDVESITSKIKPMPTKRLLDLIQKVSENEHINKRSKEIKENNLKILSKIQELKTHKTEIEQTKSQLEGELEWVSPAIPILKTDLPNYITTQVGLVIQEEINNFIHAVFPNYEVLLQNDRKGVTFFYTSDINMPKTLNKWIDTRMSSGMERSMLTIAFKVALCKLYNIKTLVLDEVDSAASIESSEILMNSIISSGLFDRIIIITHKPEIIDILENACIYNVTNGSFTRI